MKLLKDKFYYAFCGVKLLFLDASVRLQMLMAIIALMAGILFRFTTIEMVLLVLVCALVIISESINSVIEKIMDMIQPEFDERVKIIKDMAAGFVLLSSMAALFIGIILFGGKLLCYLM